MNYLSPLRLLSLVAGVVLAIPSSSDARDIKVRRDLDGDGHSNTKRIEVSNGRYGGGRYYGGGGRYYGGGRSYGSPYYGGRYYGSRYYGYSGYGYGAYGYGYPYYSPGVSFSYYGRPAPSYSEGSADDLAADVQRALKRRGYYRGGVDGDIGPGSRSAIRNFQADHNLDTNGRIDRDTLRALGI